MMKFPNNLWNMSNTLLMAFAKSFSATRQLVHTAILDGNKKREVSLNYLISETSFEAFTVDTYFEQYDQSFNPYHLYKTARETTVLYLLHK